MAPAGQNTIILALLVCAWCLCLAVLSFPRVDRRSECPVQVIRVQKRRSCGELNRSTLDARSGPYEVSLPAAAIDGILFGLPVEEMNCVVNECMWTEAEQWRAVNQSSSSSCVSSLRVGPWHLDAPAASEPRVCAVVSSGGVLSRAGCGARIDAADFVFRANNPPTSGYESDVGSRTDVLVLNRFWAEWLSGSAPLDERNTVPEQRIQIPPKGTKLIFRRESEQELQHVASWLCDASGQSRISFDRQQSWDVFRTTAEWDRALTKWYQRISPESWALPTTGMVGAMLAFALCDEVQLFGFRDWDGPYHYFGNPDFFAIQSGAGGPALSTGSMWWHDFSSEHALVAEMAGAGLLLSLCDSDEQDAYSELVGAAG